MIEFALVLAMLIFLIISILDLGRYIAVRAVLLRGTQEGLNLALKLSDTELDTLFTATNLPKVNNA